MAEHDAAGRWGRPFDWYDGDRTVRFGPGRVLQASELLGGSGWTLFATARALRAAPGLAEGAAAVLEVPSGPVAVAARAMLDRGVPGERLVALGGGRVIDTAKACADALRAQGRPVQLAAVPTTLSGAEMTWIHRHAEGVDEGVPRRRPDLVLNDPDLSASQPIAELAASTLNALGHAAEAPMTVRANPVATATAFEAARALAAGWAGTEPDRPALAVGALLSGAAIDSAWYGLHHVLAQTLVQDAGLAHGAANAAMLPVTLQALRERAPQAVDRLGAALGEDPVRFARRIGTLAGVTGLAALGVDGPRLPDLAGSAAQRRELDLIPPRADRAELLALYERAMAFPANRT